MPSHRGWVGVALLSVGLLGACASRPVASAGSSQCRAKDGSKYDASSLTEVEARLQHDGAQVAWDAVLEPYRPWANAHLQRKLGRAAATLVESRNCREVEAAASKIKPLGKRIAEAAKKCDDAQCLADSKAPAPIDAELELALCPLYPFC